MSGKNVFGVLFCFAIIIGSIACVLVSPALASDTFDTIASYAIGGFLPMAVGGLLLFCIFAVKSQPNDNGW